jgi:hypothetical protein
MKLNVYTVYDVASGIHQRPLFATADGEIMRSFADIAMDAEHPIGQHPEDYTLIRIGTFDDATGELFPEKHTKLLTGQQVVTASRQVPPDDVTHAVQPGQEE